MWVGPACEELRKGHSPLGHPQPGCCFSNKNAVCTDTNSVIAACSSNSGWVKSSTSTNTATTPLLPFVQTILKLNFKCKHCEYIFKNQKHQKNPYCKDAQVINNSRKQTQLLCFRDANFIHTYLKLSRTEMMNT